MTPDITSISLTFDGGKRLTIDVHAGESRTHNTYSPDQLITKSAAQGTPRSILVSQARLSESLACETRSIYTLSSAKIG